MLPTARMGLTKGSLRPLAPIIFTGAFFSGGAVVSAAIGVAGWAAPAGAAVTDVLALTFVPVTTVGPFPAVLLLDTEIAPTGLTAVLSPGPDFFEDRVPVATGTLVVVPAALLLVPGPLTEEAGTAGADPVFALPVPV